MVEDERPVAEIIDELRRDAIYRAVETGKPYLETLDEAFVESIEFIEGKRKS